MIGAFDDIFPGAYGIGSAWAEFSGGSPDLPLLPLEKKIGELNYDAVK